MFVWDLLYIFSPRVYGDSFHNNKDILFLSLTIFSIFFAFKIYKKKKIKNIFFFFLFAALATSTRVIGIFLPISVIFFLFLEVLNSKKHENTKYYFLILFFYFLSLVIHWPYLWIDPFSNFLEFFIKSKNWVFSYYILFDGKYFFTTILPESFIFTWISISTPILNYFFYQDYFSQLKDYF